MVTVSGGLFLAGPGSGAGLTADEVYRRADDALYRAKEAGRARWALAEPEHRESAPHPETQNC